MYFCFLRPARPKSEAAPFALLRGPLRRSTCKQSLPPAMPVPEGFGVRVDKRPSQAWPQTESLKIQGLDLQERHLLAVLGAHGKPIESLWFRFSDYKSVDLCMSYDGYQGIGLQEAKRSPWCKCK